MMSWKKRRWNWKVGSNGIRRSLSKSRSGRPGRRGEGATGRRGEREHGGNQDEECNNFGTKILWHLDFHPDAELVVSGKRILAVTKSKKAIYLNEITPPPAKSK